MFGRNPYTNLGSKHRPYLEAFFHNPKEKIHSSRTFAMVDSGADHTTIPYSIGSSIGLHAPTSEEELLIVGGIGGNVSFVERECQIYIINKFLKKMYVFNETVWWMHPDNSTNEQKDELIIKYRDLKKFKDESKKDTSLEKHFIEQMSIVENEILEILNKFEIGSLLGRPFFDNFDFIQFFHKDRQKEERCYFNYVVSKGKPVEIIEGINL